MNIEKKPTRKRGSRGFTIVELCIVLALLSIVGLLMTSFMTAFNIYTLQNQNRNDFLEEVSLVRDEMQSWLTNHDINGTTIQVNADWIGQVGSADQVVFTDGTFIFSYSDSQKNSVKTVESIKKITYEVFVYTPPQDADPGASYESSNRILKCTFTGYDINGNEYSQVMLFSLASDDTKFIFNGTN